MLTYVSFNFRMYLSCSWGPDDDGRTVDGPHPLGKVSLSESFHLHFIKVMHLIMEFRTRTSFTIWFSVLLPRQNAGASAFTHVTLNGFKEVLLK